MCKLGNVVTGEAVGYVVFHCRCSRLAVPGWVPFILCVQCVRYFIEAVAGNVLGVVSLCLNILLFLHVPV